MPKTKKFFIETEELVAMVLRFQRGEKTLEDEIYKVFYDKIYGRIFKKIKNPKALDLQRFSGFSFISFTSLILYLGFNCPTV